MSEIAEPTHDDRAVHEALTWIRRSALALPETSERLSHGAPTFFIREKKTFVMFVDDTPGSHDTTAGQERRHAR